MSSMSVPKGVSSSSVTTQCPSTNIAEQFLVPEWNLLASFEQDMIFNGSVGLSSYGIRIPQENTTTNTGVVKQIPTPSAFNNESLPETVNSLDLSESNQVASVHCPLDFPSINNHGVEKNIKTKKRKSMTETGNLQPHYPQDRVQTIEAEQKKDVLPESGKSPQKKDARKQKGELKPDANACKPNEDDDSSKEDYLHVRAKRGQATNSHSLAERVRREKISERMRVLQDLVPGCNKITGKAVMLDEIINYVQSLQRQVEFLSMKLAAVNPDLNFDMERILSKNILHSRDGSSAILGLGPRMNTYYPQLHQHELMQSEMLVSNIPNLGEMIWDDELHNVVQLGFIPNPSLSGSELNGSMKM